jgi:hypothetical protein
MKPKTAQRIKVTLEQNKNILKKKLLQLSESIEYKVQCTCEALQAFTWESRAIKWQDTIP